MEIPEPITVGGKLQKVTEPVQPELANPSKGLNSEYQETLNKLAIAGIRGSRYRSVTKPFEERQKNDIKP